MARTVETNRGSSSLTKNSSLRRSRLASSVSPADLAGAVAPIRRGILKGQLLGDPPQAIAPRPAHDRGERVDVLRAAQLPEPGVRLVVKPARGGPRPTRKTGSTS